jgi:ubiquinone/menaquinone biosynthesis C-methylase UbiE
LRGEAGSHSDPIDARFARDVKTFYDSVSDEYDTERDAWTKHYNYSTSEFLRVVLSECRPKAILDVGIGSGDQILLYAAHRADVSGIDWSKGMLRVAAYKSAHAGLKAHLVAADAQALPFASETFDFVACCGSVLNYCAKPELSIAELSRVLRHSGTLVIGFDNRVSLDFVWVLTDAITRHRTKYRIEIKDAVRWFSQPGPIVSYPYLKAEGEIGYLPERFLSHRHVSSVLASKGLVIRHAFGVHVLSNLIPFTLISNPKSGPWLVKLARRLSSLDRILKRFGAVNRLADHILIDAIKT